MYKKIERFDIEIFKKTLANKANIFLFKKPKAPITISAVFHSGNRFSKKDGVPHFLEHMLMAGSKKFPSKDLLSKEIEGVGGSFSAFTANETVVFEVIIPEKEDIDTATNLLNEILCNPLFDEITFKNEKGSILSEQRKNQSNPGSYIYRVTRKLLYQGTPAGGDILSSEDNIESITLDEVKKYYADFIVSGRMCFIVTGDIGLEELSKSIENNINLTVSEKFIITGELPIIKDKKILIEKYAHTKDHIHFNLGFRLPVLNFKEMAAASIIGSMLAGSRSSILLNELRYKRGLIYSIIPSNNFCRDYSSMSLYSDCHKNDFKEIIKIIKVEIDKIKNDSITQKDLDFVRNKFIKSEKISFEKAEDWLIFSYDLLAKPNFSEFIDEQDEEIRKLTPSDLSEFAKKYFIFENYFISICGNVEESEVIF